ncbi:hypothetical protein F5B22DRAFT_281682 [Xylaria bambusicola]|uniref:uncharacterized protein n=1 Tax=Xylaria bambusicola TaxID=326684 RepID=UPI0020080369|nr:uncharacterized protein F5B22DRAFT_281682 [Xylaria bambusicola]KAI0512961.1 hypothetical protein F5B22DRAFT_281682 [Xylaria bambusicola]
MVLSMWFSSGLFLLGWFALHPCWCWSLYGCGIDRKRRLDSLVILLLLVCMWLSVRVPWWGVLRC